MKIEIRKYLPLLILATLIIASILAYLSAKRGKPPTVRLEGKTMGTTWSAVFVDRGRNIATDKLKSEIENKLKMINRQMSTYDPSSEISRFNDSNRTDWFPVSSETVEVIQLAQETSRISGGYFDVTVGPLVDLWGFGPKPRKGQRPSESEIVQLLGKIGYRHLFAMSTPPAIRKDIPELRIDLSAIAKGYAVDKVAEILNSRGIKDMVVEIGGEMHISGKRGDGDLWRIAVEKPEEGERGVERIFHLKDTGMATSGNYRNFFVENGVRYGHTIDPFTGRSVRHKLASVTVLDSSCARADALATAIMAMGDEKGVKFCRCENIAAYLIMHNGKGLTPLITDSFKNVLESSEK